MLRHGVRGKICLLHVFTVMIFLNFVAGAHLCSPLESHWWRMAPEGDCVQGHFVAADDEAVFAGIAPRSSQSITCEQFCQWYAPCPLRTHLCRKPTRTLANCPCQPTEAFLMLV